MKKSLLLLIGCLLFFALCAPTVFAQKSSVSPAPSGTHPTPTAIPVTPTPITHKSALNDSDPIWKIDAEVTSVGKSAARAGELLTYSLANYQWSCLNLAYCGDGHNPLLTLWFTVVTPLALLFFLITIWTYATRKEKNGTNTPFIPRSAALFLLLLFSYLIMQFLLQFTDFVQGVLLSHGKGFLCPPDCISQRDLLFIGWDYQKFIGLRLLGDQNIESGSMTLLLTNLTAWTYNGMTILLLFRKLILWFFLILSPITLLLLFYPATYKVGKILTREFFRWLLYGPLFALFLSSMVVIWATQIPLQFALPQNGMPDKIMFPTAVNILLGGPKQFVTPTNSINLPETYLLYVCCLLMMWLVIVLPWIILHLFFRHGTLPSVRENATVKKLIKYLPLHKTEATPSKEAPSSSGGKV